MRTHSQTRNRTARRRRSPPKVPPEAPDGFLNAWATMVSNWVPQPPRRRGRKPRVPLTNLLPALTFHVLTGAGTLADHFYQLFGEPLADSSWADRRARLPWQIFADLMQRALRPQATRHRHRDAFWRGWRLVALDGTQFSLINTPQILDTIPKARTRRGGAAFGKITTAVLLELGLHNPLAAAIGRRGQSEWALAPSLLARLPKGALLLADRLYGCAAFAAQAWAVCDRVGSHFLLRAKTGIKSRLIKRLADGSRVIRVAVRRSGEHRVRQWVEVREIRVRVWRRGHRTHEMRLWTSLMDPRTAPALELAPLYAQRWEHELYFRNVKRQLRKSEVLQSHTVDTAAQEIAAVVLASALLATERARAAAGHVPVLRVSFAKVLELVRPMWLLLGSFDDVVTDRQKSQVVRRLYKLMRRCVTAKRRSRTNPRAVRQPIRGWPRLQQTNSVEGPLQFKVV